MQIDYKIFTRHFSAETTQKEEEILQNWLKESPANQKQMQHLEVIWASPEPITGDSDVESAWNRIAEKAKITLLFQDARENIQDLNQVPTSSIEPWAFQKAIPYLRYAAVILLILTLPVIYFLTKNTSENALSELSTLVIPNGQQGSITLVDGTIITLDAGSELSYPKSFNGMTREVSVRGEAYFEVAQNQQQPFVVYAGRGIVKVLGTKFNVRSWEFMNEVRVAVLEGKVSFQSNQTSDDHAVKLKKGEGSLLRGTEKRPSSATVIDGEAETAWMNRNLILNNTPLREVIHQLQRWYDLKIELPNSKYNSTRITGNFKKDQVDEILRQIGMTIHLKVRRDGNTVAFSK